MLFNSYIFIFCFLPLTLLGYADKLELVDPTLKAYDAVLAQEDLDYSGTRLHAGIRALSKGRRSLIISIDNRAECISTDTGLPTIRRDDLTIALKARINEKIETNIALPRERIREFKAQFEKR